MSNVQVQLGGNSVQVQVQSSGFARANAAVTLAAASATAAAASAAAAAATLAGAALRANNLSDLASASTARTNLGLTALATTTPGTGVATALAVNVGSAGAFTTFNGAGGTPSSMTLTNATGLPVAGITASTTQALGVGSLELGHASDTTLARSSAGNVSVEGNLIYRAGGTDVPVADGGTGSSTAADARTALAVVGTAALAANTGAALVGAVQTGTGAVDRTAQAKMRDTITDADFSTLQQALTAAAGKTLYVTAAWTISAAVTVPANTTVVGAGGSVTTNGAGFNAVEAAGDNVTIRGLTVIGPASSATPASTDVGNGIWAIGRYNLSVQNCRVSGFNNVGIVARDCFNVIIDRNILFSNTYPTTGGNDSGDIALYSSTAGGRANITNNLCLSNNSQGVYVNALGRDNDVVISGNICVATSAGGAELASGSLSRRHGIVLAYQVQSGNGRIVCQGNVIRNTNSTGIYLTGTTNLIRAISIIGNTISLVGLDTSIQGSLTGGITIAGGGHGTIVAYNSIYDFRGTTATASINISTSIAGASGSIIGNTIDLSTNDGIVLQDAATGWIVRNNTLRNVVGIDIYENTSANGGHIIAGNDILRANANNPSIYVTFGTGTRPTIIEDNQVVGFSKSAVTTESNTGILLINNLNRRVITRRNRVREYQFGIRPANVITTRVYDLVQIDDNLIENCVAGITPYAFATTGVLPVCGNTFDGCTNDLSGAGGNMVGYIAERRNGKILLLDQTAAPAVGTWVAGDRADFLTPAAGAVPGAVCTTAGNPGTWKSYAAVAA